MKNKLEKVASVQIFLVLNLVYVLLVNNNKICNLIYLVYFMSTQLF